MKAPYNKACQFVSLIYRWNEKPLNDLEVEVQRTIKSLKLLRIQQRVAVALSGGMDSVALLFCLARLVFYSNLSLSIVHINHNARNAAQEEELFTLYLANKLSCPWFCCKIIQPIPCNTSKEEHWRNVRYSFFNSLNARIGERKIALAHHLDDQLETMLMFFLRGSGRKGLSSLRLSRDNEIIRPFLHIKKSDIERYVKQYDLPYYEDASNEYELYLRNRIRKRVIPILKDINPGIYKTARRLHDIYENEEGLLSYFVGKLLDKVVIHADEGEVHLDRHLIMLEPRSALLQVVRACFDKYFLSTINKTCLESLAQKVHLKNYFSFLINEQFEIEGIYDRITIRRLFNHKDNTRGWLVKIAHAHEGLVKCPYINIILKVKKLTGAFRNESLLFKKNNDVVFFDYNRINFPLMLRPARYGDKIQVYGMKGRIKKLKSIFIDLKIPKTIRWQIPVLEVEGRIVWVLGIRRSIDALVSKGTKCILMLEIERFNNLFLRRYL